MLMISTSYSWQVSCFNPRLKAAGRFGYCGRSTREKFALRYQFVSHIALIGYYQTAPIKIKKWYFISHVPLPSMHQVKGLIDLGKGQCVSNKLIHHQLLTHVVINQLRNTLHTLPTLKAKRISFCYEVNYLICYIYATYKKHIIYAI